MKSAPQEHLSKTRRDLVMATAKGNHAARALKTLSLGVVLGTCLVACAAIRKKSDAAPERAPFESKSSAEGRFISHPRQVPKILERIELGDGSVFVTDELGGRILESGKSPSKRSDLGAPEALEGVVRDGERFLYLGRSGALYVSGTPLGAITPLARPDGSFSQAAFFEKDRKLVVVGVSERGTLHVATRKLESRDPDLRFSPLALEAFSVDVGFDRRGHLFALTVPERLYISDDSGGTFRPLSEKYVGAARFERSSSSLVVKGLLGDFELAEAFLPHVPEPRGGSVAVERIYASARAVAEGRASLAGSRFVRFDRDGERIVSQSGDAAGPLAERAHPELSACIEPRSTTGHGFVHVLCTLEGGGVSPRLAWFRGTSIEHLERSELPLRGRFGDGFRMRATARGGLLVTGLCAPHDRESGCEPSGIGVLSERGQAVLPFAFGEKVAALHADARSRSLVVSRHPERGALWFTVFDGEGRELRRRELSRLSLGLSNAKDVTSSISEDADGSIDVLLEEGEKRRILGFSTDLDLSSVAALPIEFDAVGLSGHRVLGIDGDTGLYFESLDDGLSFSRGTLPFSLCADHERDCHPFVRCDESLCLLGDELVRVGFGGAALVKSDVPLMIRTSTKRASMREVFTCRSRGVSTPLRGVSSEPTAHEAALGNAAFYATALDEDLGSVGIVASPFGSEALETTELFPPLSNPEEYALAVSPQVEGTVALRYRIPSSRRGRTDISDVTVAWDNRIEGIHGIQSLARTIRPFPGDFEGRADRTERAKPGLLSIAGQGVFLRIHPGPAGHEPTFFLTKDGVREIPAPKWPERLLSSAQEVFMIDAEPVFLNWFGEGRLFARAERRSGDDRFSAFTLGVLDAEARGLLGSELVAYRGKEVGFLTTRTDRRFTHWSSSFVPLVAGGYGPVRPTPSIADVAEIEACVASRREDSVRVVATLPPEDDWSLDVTPPGSGPIRLAAKRATLFGEVKDPCIGAIELEQIGASRLDATRHSALYFPMESGASMAWLFRIDRLPSGKSEVSAQVLECD